MFDQYKDLIGRASNEVYSNSAIADWISNKFGFGRKQSCILARMFYNRIMSFYNKEFRIIR